MIAFMQIYVWFDLLSFMMMQGDFHHWVDLFNHFDSYFEKHIKPRRDLQVEDNFLESDPPFPRDAVLQILCVTRIILENCTNKHFYSSYEVLLLLYEMHRVYCHYFCFIS